MQPKDLEWANHIFQWFMVADINSNEVTKKRSTSIIGLKWGLVPPAMAIRLQIWERQAATNRHQGLHYTDFSGREDPPMDNVALCSEEHTFANLFEEL